MIDGRWAIDPTKTRADNDPPAAAAPQQSAATHDHPNELRERVARALFLHAHPGSTAWDKPDEGNRAAWFAQADAVLAVLPAAVVAPQESPDDRLREALRALHKRVYDERLAHSPWCEADGRVWPCPTIRLLGDVDTQPDEGGQ